MQGDGAYKKCFLISFECLYDNADYRFNMHPPNKRQRLNISGHRLSSERMLQHRTHPVRLIQLRTFHTKSGELSAE